MGMTAQSELRAIKQQLREADLAVPAVLSAEEQQRLFLELRGELRAEQGFKSLLEYTPGITAATSWPLVKRKVHARCHCRLEERKCHDLKVPRPRLHQLWGVAHYICTPLLIPA